jgi:hypothetical protein
LTDKEIVMRNVRFLGQGHIGESEPKFLTPNNIFFLLDSSTQGSFMYKEPLGAEAD